MNCWQAKPRHTVFVFVMAWIMVLMNETELNLNEALSQIHAERMVGCKCGINLVNFDLLLSFI